MRTVADADRRFNFTVKRLEEYQLPEGRNDVYLFDVGKTNLVCRIRRTSNGGSSKVFYSLRTCGETHETTRTRIGRLGEYTVEQARDWMDAQGGKIARDGGEIKKPERSGKVTLSEAFEDHLANHIAAGGRSASNKRRNYRLYLEQYAKTRMDDITREWVRQNITHGIVNDTCLDEKRKKSRRNGGRSTANAVIALLGSIFTTYMDKDENNQRPNPCCVPKGSKHTLKYRNKAKKQAMTSDESKRFIKAIATFKANEGFYKHDSSWRGWVKGARIEKRHDMADALHILALLGRRHREVARMRFEDVAGLDTDSPTWRIPKEDCKTGVEQTVTLNPTVAQMIRERRARITGDYVLPGALADRMADDGRPEKAELRDLFSRLLRMVGITNPRLSIHSLRNTFITQGIRMNMHPDAISMAVGHADARTTSGYASLVVDDQRKVSDAIAASMEQAAA